MKDIIKNLEKMVLESITLLEKVETKERHTKYLGDDSKTNLSINIDFEQKKLKWIYVKFQWGILHQFNVVFFKSIAGDWYKSIDFSSFFYDLEENEQIKRMDFVLNKYNRLIKLMTE